MFRTEAVARNMKHVLCVECSFSCSFRELMGCARISEIHDPQIVRFVICFPFKFEAEGLQNVCSIVRHRVGWAAPQEAMSPVESATGELSCRRRKQ
jgi:hypothetical protein